MKQNGSDDLREHGDIAITDCEYASQLDREFTEEQDMMFHDENGLG